MTRVLRSTLSKALLLTATSLLLASCGGSSGGSSGGYAPNQGNSSTVTKPNTNITQPSKPSTNTGSTGGTTNSGSNSGSNSGTTESKPTPQPDTSIGNGSTNNGATNSGAEAPTPKDPLTLEANFNANKNPFATPENDWNTSGGVKIQNAQFTYDTFGASTGSAQPQKQTVTSYLGSNWDATRLQNAFSQRSAVTGSNTSTPADQSKSRERGVVTEDTTGGKSIFDLASDEISKVLVVENEMTSFLDLKSSRLTRAYRTPNASHKEGDENNILTVDNKDPKLIGESSHAEKVVYATMGYGVLQIGDGKGGVEEIKPIPTPLYKHGKVYFLGDQQDKFTSPGEFLDIVKSDAFKNAINQGYKIVNISWGINPETYETLRDNINKNIDREGAPNYDFDKRYEANSKDLLKTLNEVHLPRLIADTFHLQTYQVYTKNQDALFFFSTGNAGPATMSGIGLGMFTTDYDLSNLRQNSIFVTAYNASSATTTNPKDLFTTDIYATPCGVNKYQCVAAYDRLFLINSDKTYEWLKEQKKTNADVRVTPAYEALGTSFSSPYAASATAIVKAVYPFMTNTNLQTTVLTTALDIGEKGVDDKYGWGLIQPQVAVNGPQQILYGEFKADLAHDGSLFDKTKEFTFYNPISGEGNLIVTSAQGRSNVLTLAGANTYTGTTAVMNYGQLNITGTVSSPLTLVHQTATLKGSGAVKSLHNAGTVQAYSQAQYDAAAKGEHTVTQPGQRPSGFDDKAGLLVEGDYKQAAEGTLSVLLGQPLLVTGNVTLNGTLEVAGVSKAILTTNDMVYDDVLVTKGKVDGIFDKVVSKTPLLTFNTTNGSSLVNNSYTVNGVTLQAVVLKAKYNKVIPTLASLDGYADLTLGNQELAFSGAENLDALFEGVRAVNASNNVAPASQGVTLSSATDNFTWGTSLFSVDNVTSGADATSEAADSSATDNNTADSSTETTPAPSNTTEANSNPASTTQSPLEQLLANLQSSHSGQAIIETALAFSGGEFTSMLHHNKLLTLQALTAGSKQFYHVGADDQLESNVGVNYFNGTDGGQVVNTQADVSYVHQGHKLGASFFTGSSNWYHTLSPKSNSDRYAGALLGYAVMLQERFGLNLVAGYSQHDNKLMRDLNVLGKVYNFQDDLKLREYILGANLFNTYTKDGHNFMAYYGVNKHYSYLEGFGEQFDGFSLNVGKQKFSNLYMQLGLRYNYNDLLHVNGLSLEADYNFNHSLRRWYAMHANLTDAKLSVGQRFLNQNELGIHQVSIALTQQLDPTWSVTGKLSLLKQKEVYRNVGLEVNAKF